MGTFTERQWAWRGSISCRSTVSPWFYIISSKVSSHSRVWSCLDSPYSGIKSHTTPKHWEQHVGTGKGKRGQWEYVENKKQLTTCEMKYRAIWPAPHQLPSLIKLHTGLGSHLHISQEWAEATGPSELICLQQKSWRPAHCLCALGLSLSHLAQA